MCKSQGPAVKKGAEDNRAPERHVPGVPKASASTATSPKSKAAPAKTIPNPRNDGPLKLPEVGVKEKIVPFFERPAEPQRQPVPAQRTSAPPVQRSAQPTPPTSAPRMQQTVPISRTAAPTTNAPVAKTGVATICRESDPAIIKAERLGETVLDFLKDWANKVNAFPGKDNRETRRPADHMNLVTLQDKLGIPTAARFNITQLEDISAGSTNKQHCIARVSRYIWGALSTENRKLVIDKKTPMPILFDGVTWKNVSPEFAPVTK
jgi:hypothetical protein